MALTRLPTELLEAIIKHALPEGFESLAVTCKKIYAICIPFIQRHNALRSEFDHFTYHENTKDPYASIVSAGDLIKRIAVEPIVARYIQYANFTRDCPRSFIKPFHYEGDGFPGEVDYSEDLRKLLANSPYLEQAGLDWREYLAKIEEQLVLGTVPRYSQHAAAFLLTLLPNAETLILPRPWKLLDTTDKLVDAIVHKARHSYSFCDSPSLAQVTRLETYAALTSQEWIDLNSVRPLLALPRIRFFVGVCCVVLDDDRKSIKTGETLESAFFVASCMNEMGIANFLKDTTRLKTLSYSHLTKTISPQCWDICKFVAAIERQVGSHLVELSISFMEPFPSIAPGKVSMRGFTCLRQLEFPLEIVMCNITAVGGLSDPNTDCDGLFIGDLIPASVSVLSLISSGRDHHDKALNVMFRDFAARKETALPALKEIHLTCPDDAEQTYKDHCAWLLKETQKAGVALHLEL